MSRLFQFVFGAAMVVAIIALGVALARTPGASDPHRLERAECHALLDAARSSADTIAAMSAHPGPDSRFAKSCIDLDVDAR